MNLGEDMERRIENILNSLEKSKFRSSFKLGLKDIKYIEQKGMDTIVSHAKDFVASRLADKSKFKDGKQTPMHGHPVFIAQHATATCCRECLSKWHHIEHSHVLTNEEQEYVVSVIIAWIKSQIKNFDI